MSATNKTPFLELPVFVATDKPSWLGDFDCAMQKIDTGVSVNATGVTEAKEAAATADAKAVAAQTTADNATTLANQGIQAAATAQAEAELAHTTADSAVLTANDANEKFYTLNTTVSTHTSQITAIRAVNEAQGGRITANGTDIALNTASINELKAAGYAKVVRAEALVSPSGDALEILYQRSIADGINLYTDVIFRVVAPQAAGAILITAMLPASYAYKLVTDSRRSVIERLGGPQGPGYSTVSVVAPTDEKGFYFAAAEAIEAGYYRYISVDPMEAKNG